MPMDKETILDFSAIESSLLQLKVGRCNVDFFDEKKLLSQIISGEYDLCRLRIAAEDEMASVKLHAIGLPFFFSGSIRRYKTRISASLPGQYNHPGLQYEMYDGSQDALLKFMLVDTWGHYPIGYYRSPFLNRLVDKEREIECVFQYYKKHNNNRDNPGNSILFMKDGDNYVGFFALNVVGSNLESHIGGICKKYQQGGYFYDMLRFIKEYCISHQLEHFIFGARNENTVVQHAFENARFKSVATENVFHIASLLSFSKAEPLKQDIKIKESEVSSLSNLLINNVLKNVKVKNVNFRQNSTTVKVLKPGSRNSNYQLVIATPINQKEEFLSVTKIYNTKNELSVIGYINLK